uniref:Uncharacterized protein n=1 Tax=Eptatretus burgeri TaxID=7764 RepID=A0A8C4QR61_EPTBU
MMLEEIDVPRDVQSGQQLQQQVRQLLPEIRLWRKCHEALQEKVHEVLSREPDSGELHVLLKALDGHGSELTNTWENQDNWLSEILRSLRVEKDAERAEATLSSHEAFLKLDGLGDSVGEVESLQKRHEEFEISLRAFDNMVEDLEGEVSKMSREGNVTVDRHVRLQQRAQLLVD